MEPKTPPISTTDESAASGSSSSSKKRGREEIELDYSGLDDAIATNIANLVFVSHSLEPQAPIILYYNEQCQLQKAKALYLMQKINLAGVDEVIINPAEEARKGSYVIKLVADSGNPEVIDFRVSRVT
ncbi:hypothetical protein BVRB_2g034880 [Beta vulgaris subsp. vulgaris]|nr:hypothetical protein BVRB_2g034880 [Beta vulgaris subsp. vulgaris]